MKCPLLAGWVAIGWFKWVYQKFLLSRDDMSVCERFALLLMLLLWRQAAAACSQNVRQIYVLFAVRKQIVVPALDTRWIAAIGEEVVEWRAERCAIICCHIYKWDNNKNVYIIIGLRISVVCQIWREDRAAVQDRMNYWFLAGTNLQSTGIFIYANAIFRHKSLIN